MIKAKMPSGSEDTMYKCNSTQLEFINRVERLRETFVIIAVRNNVRQISRVLGNTYAGII